MQKTEEAAAEAEAQRDGIFLDASLSFSFSSASRRSPYFEPSAGYTPEKTIGCA